MTGWSRPSLIAIISLVILVPLSAQLSAQGNSDPFYLRRLDAGKAAWASGDFQQAAEELRIAAFGFLDDLDLLSETLARLAVAQQAAGMNEEAIASARRFVEVEAMAATYGNWGIPPEMEQSLGDLLSLAVPNERLGTIPTLSGFHTSHEQRLMSLTGRDRTRALEQQLESDPGNPRWYLLLAQEALGRGSARDAAEWVNRGIDAIPGDRALIGMRGELLLRQDDCAEAWDSVRELTPFPGDLGEAIFLCLVRKGNTGLAMQVLGRLEQIGFPLSIGAERARNDLRSSVSPEAAAGGTSSGEPQLPPIVSEPPATSEPPPTTTPEQPIVTEEAVPEPETLDEAGTIARARALVRDRQPDLAKDLLVSISTGEDSRELSLAILEAAVLSRDWTLALRATRSLTPFRRSEPAAIIYAAITLYESNRLADARRLFEYARPMVGDSELVKRYEELIMGR